MFRKRHTFEGRKGGGLQKRPKFTVFFDSFRCVSYYVHTTTFEHDEVDHDERMRFCTQNQSGFLIEKYTRQEIQDSFAEVLFFVFGTLSKNSILRPSPSVKGVYYKRKGTFLGMSDSESGRGIKQALKQPLRVKTYEPEAVEPSFQGNR